MSQSPWRRPKPHSDFAPKPSGPPHVFRPYATVCVRCGLTRLYAGLPDTPPCVSDEQLAARRALARLKAQRRR